MFTKRLKRASLQRHSESEIAAGPPSADALIAQLRSVCRAAANGDLEPRATGIDNELGEFAELAWEINELLDVTTAFVREAAASMSSAGDGRFFRKVALRGMPGEFRRSSETINAASDIMKRQAEDLKTEEARVLGMAEEFERIVGQEIGAVVEAAERMRDDADRMASLATETTERSTTVAAATEEATANVQAVASAAEELASTIRDVSARAAESSQTSGRARGEADQTAERIGQLTESTARIDQVVTFINEIASQTNLLALNATIEAARAGEAGKGFAVVASEVKSLAGQTAKATEEIAAQVRGVQDALGRVVEAMSAINGTIDEMDTISGAISQAVDQQAAATQEISSNVHQAAAGTGDVAENIVAVSDSARKTGDAAGRLLESAQAIVSRSGTLREESNRFLEAIRAA